MERNKAPGTDNLLLPNRYKTVTLTVQLDNHTYTIPIDILRGVRQYGSISPKLFTVALEDIFKQLSWGNFGVNINKRMLNNLRFADDRDKDLQQMIRESHLASKMNSLNINLNKTKVINDKHRHRD